MVTDDSVHGRVGMAIDSFLYLIKYYTIRLILDLCGSCKLLACFHAVSIRWKWDFKMRKFSLWNFSGPFPIDETESTWSDDYHLIFSYEEWNRKLEKDCDDWLSPDGPETQTLRVRIEKNWIESSWMCEKKRTTWDEYDKLCLPLACSSLTLGLSFAYSWLALRLLFMNLTWHAITVPYFWEVVWYSGTRPRLCSSPLLIRIEWVLSLMPGLLHPYPFGQFQQVCVSRDKSYWKLWAHRGSIKHNCGCLIHPFTSDVVIMMVSSSISLICWRGCPFKRPKKDVYVADWTWIGGVFCVCHSLLVETATPLINSNLIPFIFHVDDLWWLPECPKSETMKQVNNHPVSYEFLFHSLISF